MEMEEEEEEEAKFQLSKGCPVGYAGLYASRWPSAQLYQGRGGREMDGTNTSKRSD